MDIKMDKLNFKDYLKESPVGEVGRTGKKDAEKHVTPELQKRFMKIVKEMGGKTVAMTLLNSVIRDSSTPGNYMGIVEGKDSDKENDGEEYKKYFLKMLKKYGVESPSELDTETKKKFFNEIDAGWVSDKED